jgi:hypothetical protein
MSGTTPPRNALLLPAAAFAVALLFRLVGLGGGSMWLDEIMQTLMARGSLADLGRALLFDKAVPPLDPLLTWVVLHLGWDELPRRFLNSLFGAAAIALLARWVERRFGRATAAVSALFLASSPVLVRYAHELRPYALALLLFAWALDAADRWLERGARRFPVELVLAAALASMTHYFAAVLWLPIGASFLEARASGQVDRPLGLRHLAAMALSLAPLALWWTLLFLRGGPRQHTEPADWTWELVERRFEDLLLRGFFGQPVVAHATILFAALAVVGFSLVARRRGGLAVLAGVLAGTVLVEIPLVLAGRFTHFRYNQFGLPFLYVAMAFAIVLFARQLSRWNRLSGRVAGSIVAGAVVATAATGVVGYAEHGRPDWPAVARAIEALDGRDARVAVTIPWVEISLGYYLDRYERWADGPRDVVVLFNDRARLLEEHAKSERCLPVVVASNPRVAHLFDGLYPKKPVFAHAETDRVVYYRFAAPGLSRKECRPPRGFAIEHSPGYGRLLPWLAAPSSATHGGNQQPPSEPGV